MTYRPRTLAGQLFALLLLALVLAHVLVVAMLLHMRTTEEVHPLAVRDTEQRIASIYQLLRSETGDPQRLLAQLSVDKATLDYVPSVAQDAPAMDAQEALIAQRIQDKLQLASHTPVQVRLQQLELEPEPAWSLRRFLSENEEGNPWIMDVYVPLPDGGVLHSQSQPAMVHGHWARILSFSIPVGLLPICLIALVFGRRIMQPVRDLAAAAKQISRGESVAPIAVQGPADMRELINTFNDMQGRLARYVGDRTRMIAALGHDLRTPLTSLRIRAELIESDSLRLAMVDTINEMTSMAEEILQFAQDDATLEATQKVLASELLQSAIDEQRLLGRQVTQDVAVQLEYRCRPVHLKRAIHNLMDNAARYGAVHISARVDSAKGEWQIDIEDQGPGIDPAYLEQVFEPFVRLDTTRNLEGGAGAGLGLAIARSCIRAHGGELSVHNRSEGGLRAQIVLPL